MKQRARNACQIEPVTNHGILVVLVAAGERFMGSENLPVIIPGS